MRNLVASFGFDQILTDKFFRTGSCLFFVKCSYFIKVPGGSVTQNAIYCECQLLKNLNMKTEVVGIVTRSRNGVTNSQLFFRVKPISCYEFKPVKTLSPL
jgi:hypothetical protein